MTEEDKAKFEANLVTTTDWDELKDADLVVEAVSEDMAIKKELFTKLQPIVSSDAIVASNTSGLSITEMASIFDNPSRVIGMHFFNPVPVMKLVELIRGIETTDETYNAAKQFAESLKKEVIEVNEAPLFAVN